MCLEKTERKKLPYNKSKWQREIYKNELLNWKIKQTQGMKLLPLTNESLKKEKRKKEKEKQPCKLDPTVRFWDPMDISRFIGSGQISS
jgi:hypothetical protein